MIVASILLAFGIDAWWEGVQHRRAGMVALEEVFEDLAADSTEIEVTRRTAVRQRRVALWALGHLGQPGISADSASQGLRGLYGVRRYQPVASGYIGLRNSSRLDLIEPNSLRRAIISYYETRQPQHVSSDQLLNARVSDFLEVAELDFRVSLEDDLSGFQLRQVELARAWSLIPSDPRFEPRLRSLGLRAERVEEQTLRLLRYNSALRQSIRQALGPRKGTTR